MCSIILGDLKNDDSVAVTEVLELGNRLLSLAEIQGLGVRKFISLLTS